MMAAINAAIHVFHTNISDNFTVYVKYVSNPSGLATSQTSRDTYSYSTYLAALKRRATSLNDTNAIRQLPNSATNPVTGGTQIWLTSALARLLGLNTNLGDNGFDSLITLNMKLMNFPLPPTFSTNYDLQAPVGHGNNEVLGTSSGLTEP